MTFTVLPLLRIAFWALVLNAFWELIQCALFFDMWNWGFWTITLWMAAATAIDLGLVLAVVLAASWSVDGASILELSLSGAVALVIAGGLTGFSVEWAAGALHLWTYGNNMPSVSVIGVTVGLTPVLQISVLPLICVVLATRCSRKFAQSR